MTFFSWLVIFCYGLKHSGNIIYGILALAGICLCHLATNLFDDYIDFKTLKKTVKNDIVTLPNTQKGKCAYLLSGIVSEADVLSTVVFYLSIAGILGMFFLVSRGVETLVFIAIGGVIVLLYPYLSNARLSEVAIGTAFGPLIFGGTYFVMTGNISLDAFLLSIPSMIFTLNLIFTDTLMDYDIDKNEGKKTFIGLFSKQTAILIQLILLILGYLSAFLISKLAILTIPLAIDLIISNYLYITNPQNLPIKRWYHFPFEQWEDIKKNRSVTFMFRMYQARNLMVYTSIILALSILFCA